MKQGINETMDIVKFMTALGVLIGREVANDGLQITDVFKLFESDDFRAKAAEAFSGLSTVPSELVDLSIDEGFDLSLAALEAFKEILVAFKAA